MAIEISRSLPHWNYLLTLEDDLLHLSRFVDFSGNRNTYSLEISRLLMAACAEVDVVMKQLCKRCDPKSSASTIGAYHKIVSQHAPALKSFKVTMPRFGLSMRPWVSWTQQKSPGWWMAYNKVKHHRHTHFKEATLKNSLNSVAGLFIAVLFLYRPEARKGLLAPPLRLLDVSKKHSLGQYVDRHIVPMFDVPGPP